MDQILKKRFRDLGKLRLFTFPHTDLAVKTGSCDGDRRKVCPEYFGTLYCYPASQTGTYHAQDGPVLIRFAHDLYPDMVFTVNIRQNIVHGRTPAVSDKILSVQLLNIHFISSRQPV